MNRQILHNGNPFMREELYKGRAKYSGAFYIKGSLTLSNFITSEAWFDISSPNSIPFIHFFTFYDILTCILFYIEVLLEQNFTFLILNPIKTDKYFISMVFWVHCGKICSWFLIFVVDWKNWNLFCFLSETLRDDRIQSFPSSPNLLGWTSERFSP